jgi:Zn finger protein HypA/HybF involved in hydrogenase expression
MTERDGLGRLAETAAEASRGVQASGAAEAEYASNYCPRCATHLTARSCKLICPSCGYYMSCSDFY